MCILHVPTHLCLSREQLFMFTQWGHANEISVAGEMSFSRKVIVAKGSRTEAIASVRLLLCFTVLHHLDATLPRYELQ